MTRNALTARFLAAVPTAVPVEPRSELVRTFYQDALLTRPLFIEADERRQLLADLEVLRGALLSLPDRLFGGDLEAFARALGMNDDQIRCVLRGRGSGVTRFSRSDLYADAGGFRLLEYNMGSALAGSDMVHISRALLNDARMKAFVEENDLDHVDTTRTHLDTIRLECGIEPGARPVVAITDWPESYPSLAPYMRVVAAHWSTLGVEAYACHIGELTARDGGLWLGEHRVDVVNRLFMLEDVASTPGAVALMDPVLDAAERGEVRIFTPMDAELFGCKAALAMLSDEANRPLFEEAELAALDRVLPWTRMVREGEVTLEDGSRADLLAHAVGHQEELVLKATLAHGGQAVLPGWQEGLTSEEWAARVRDAVGGPYVLQRRIRPVPEYFADEDGTLAPWTPVWGVFTTATESGGVFVRATRTDSRVDVVNLGTGASVGAVFHERTPDA
ncbi:hypothetical protein [Streptomyces sp. LaPpAH-108]|uniref:hypothetical protein n=1 Tax=Streptomyces sp. LaPpAH-108 TaxID=1155714 RepID=UPI00037EFF7B|nr:hypothetical protein [Streptomyces sp. LaPpAH-108]